MANLMFLHHFIIVTAHVSVVLLRLNNSFNTSQVCAVVLAHCQMLF